MEVRVSLGWHVEIEHNVNLLDIDASAEDLSGHQNAMFELLEAFVDLDSLWLVDTAVDALRWQGVLVKDLGKLGSVLH